MKSIVKRVLRPLVRKQGWDIGRFNPDSSLEAFIPMLFAHQGVTLVLDVGARYGTYGQMLRDTGYDGPIHSFEPVAESFEVLQKRCANDPLWEAHHFALGDQDGDLEINVGTRTTYSSFLPPDHDALEEREGLAVARTERVQMRRLDTVLPEITHGLGDQRVYLKMDTQGWDMDVVQGAGDCLNLVVALQSELSLVPLYEGMPDWRTAIDELENQGFGISAMFPLWRNGDMRLGEMDCVMVRARPH